MHGEIPNKAYLVGFIKVNVRRFFDIDWAALLCGRERNDR